MIPPALDAFAGDWRLSRRIEDRLAGQEGTLEGSARFSPDALGLVYDESGTLHLPGRPPMAAMRRYLWRAVEGGIAVAFDDGRPFHAIGTALEDRHPCGADLYRVRYDFHAWPLWRATWEVEGPRKSYVLVSDYRR